MKKIVIVIILINFSFFKVKAQEKTPKEIIKTFFSIYKTDKEKAFTYLYLLKSSEEKSEKELFKSLKEDEKRTFFGLIRTINTSLEPMGSFLGYEVLSIQTVSVSLKRAYCLVKYTKYAYVLKVDFYKPNDSWISLDIQLIDFSKIKELIGKL